VCEVYRDVSHTSVIYRLDRIMMQHYRLHVTFAKIADLSSIVYKVKCISAFMYYKLVDYFNFNLIFICLLFCLPTSIKYKYDLIFNVHYW